MDNKDKKLMTMIVLVTIFLGLVAIVFFNPAQNEVENKEKEDLYVESIRDDFADFYKDFNVYGSGSET